MNKRHRRIVKRAYSLAMMHKQRDVLEERRHRAALIQERAVAGRLLLQVDETDCDGYRSNGYTIIPAIPMAFEKFRDRRHQHAEGPVFVWIEEGAAVSPDVWEWANDVTRCGLTSFERSCFVNA